MDEELRVEQSGDAVVTISLPKVDVRLNAQDLARCVAELDDSGQASFLAALARQFAAFTGTLGPDWQASQAGKRLGLRPDGGAAVELLRTVLESAEEELVKGVMES